MSSSDSIETTGPTIDQAISQALAQLGAEQDDVTIEVLSTPRSGVLGLGARQARVRVTKRAREGAHSGVMSPPPAPPLRATPPEMRRPEARPEPPREPARQERIETARPERSETARDVRSDSPREPRREAPPRREEGRGGDEREHPRAGGGGGAPREDRREPERNEPGTGPRPGRGNPPRQEARSADGNAAGESGRGDEASPPSGNREGRSRGGRGRGGRRQQQNQTPRAAQPHDQGEERRAGDRDDDRDPFAGVDDAGNDARKIVDLQEQAREATVFLVRLLELMGEKATIEPAESDDPETLELNIKGDGSGILIGRHGQTLDAIEYMVNRLLARKIKDAAPISIDTESYRARRRRLLQRMALSKGEQAKREHVAVTLEPMPPRDRRIVHLALKDDPMIATRSTGDAFMRAVEIVPVDERRNPSERGSENRGRGRDRERDRDQDKAPPIGEQGGFKHGQKRIV
jgi:spoIIIJ-associated protein